VDKLDDHIEQSTTEVGNELEASRRLLEQMSSLFSKSPQDSGFRLKHGIDIQAQFRGHFGGRPSVDGKAAKRVPGGRMEIRLDDGQQLLKNVSVMLRVPLARKVAIGIGKLLEKPVGPI
jgi:hypothetical protein